MERLIEVGELAWNLKRHFNIRAGILVRALSCNWAFKENTQLYLKVKSDTNINENCG